MPILKRYKEALDAEGWCEDTQQLKAIKALTCLLKNLKTKKSIWPFSKKEKTKGIYLHGGVGRGKSMIMDIFFHELPDTLKSRRVHFHEFMIETHDWLHAHRGDGMDDLLPNYARHVSNNVHVLCFDEFHVTDVADAMILSRLFTALFDHGVVVISTSNWMPDNLYEGGLQRDLFLPFIKLLKKQMKVVHLDSDTDYRQLSDPDQSVYYLYPLNKKIEEKLNKIFSELAEGHNITSETLTIKGRDIQIQSANNMARFTYTELCEQPLGAEDYIGIAQKYHTVFVENIPRLNDSKCNEVKRLILLIDCLYEAHCRLIISAEDDVRYLYGGEEHAFEFDRTISRLMEMQSNIYQDKRNAK